jgi:hypothetical protein
LSPKKVSKTFGEVHEKSSQTALTKFESFIILTTFSLELGISDFGISMQANNHYGTMLSDS